MADWPKSTENVLLSPWVLATVKHRAIANPQGAVTEPFLERVRDASKQYLDG